jgi:isoleucyl-tRNA synthetase
VPIPAFYCSDCAQAILTPETIEKVAAIFGVEGSDAWWSKSVEELMPDGFKCPACGGTRFTKEKDIMDVWFDSGSSHMAVLDKRSELGWPSDMYLEGSDQHRGWFNSSLCTSVAMFGRAPYREVLTHGFLVDEQGRKQSKSSGNMVDPHKYLKQMGADILRLWVSSADYRNDMANSDKIMKQISEAYRKIRNTIRFLLGNTYDYDHKGSKQRYDDLPEIDRWALDQLARLIETVTNAFDNFEFHSAFHAIHRFCAVEMSAFYLDIIKDRLYCEKADDPLRVSAQQVLWEILRVLTLLFAPILTFTAEEIWQYLPESEVVPFAQMAYWPVAGENWRDDGLNRRWRALTDIREQVNKSLEEARAAKVLGHSLEAKVILKAGKGDYELLNEHESDLADLFIVSQVELVFSSDDSDSLDARVVSAEGAKCPRCWKFHKDVEKEGVCPRCSAVLKRIAR